MFVGVNWTFPQTLPVIKQLIQHKIIDFFEISVDNFIHLSPERIMEATQGVPVGLHILSSRFLEKSENELQDMAVPLRKWIEFLKPLYVSDHLAQFTTKEKRQLPLVLELDYDNHYSHILQRVSLWQEMLGQQLLLENFPSHSVSGCQQALFFEKLMRESGAGLLFDFSNAYIAELNGICNFKDWKPLLNKTKHFHVAGFRNIESVAMDTHDVPVSKEVAGLMRQAFFEMENGKQKTLVVERDIKTDFELWKDEVLQLKHSIKLEVQHV